MTSFFRFFAECHVLANLLVIMVLLIGISSLTKLKRDTYPNVEFGELTIRTVYPGASAEDVEINVTNKIEDEIKTVSGIKKMTSVSMENVSSIAIIIEAEENIQDVVQDIRTAVDRVTDLPPEVEEAPLVTEISTEIIPIIEVGFAGSPDTSYDDLREFARIIEKKIKRIDGISNILRNGYLDREVKIEAIPEKLDTYQLSVNELISAIKARNIRNTAGSFESYVNERNVVTLAEFEDPSDVGNVIVRSTFEGPQVRVKDVADIIVGYEDENVISHVNGKKAVSFVLLKSEHADVIRTVDAVKDLIEKETAFLPDGISLQYSNDVSRYVRNRLFVVMSNALIGLILVLVILTVFFNLRTAFWVAIGIPVTMLAVFFMMPLFGAYIEVVSLSALIIVIGIIVDDAIIVSENIAAQREKGDSPIDAAVNGLAGVFKPVFTTILTTFLAFSPMFFMSGILGKFVSVIPLVISLALFFSLAEVTIALPAHLVPGMKRITPGTTSGRAHWFDTVKLPFKRMIRAALPYRVVFVLFFTLLFAVSLAYAYLKMSFVLFPSDSADIFIVNVEMPVGTSLKATEDYIYDIESIILNMPKNEITSFVTRIGQGGDVRSFMLSESENLAMIEINLSPLSERSRLADEIAEDLRERTTSLTGHEKLTVIVDGGGPPVGKPIEVRVIGSDDAMRNDLSEEIFDFFDQMDGVSDVETTTKIGKEQISISLDYSRLARLGLTVSDVAQTLRIAYEGDIVTSVRYGDEDVDFRVLLASSARENEASLSDISIPNQSNQLIRLSEVATFEIEPGPTNIYHYDGERSIAITAEVDNEIVTPINAINKMLNAFNVDKDWRGMQLIVGGEGEETQKSMQDLTRTFSIAALGIFFLLVLLFNSFSKPLLVLLAIPFGLIGVIFVFTLHGIAPGFMAMMGVIGMAGVVVNDSLVLVSHLNDLREMEPDRPLLDIVVEGTTNRLRPIVITTLTTVAGVLPLAYGLGGSDPFLAPMALSLGYGIFFATPLTLILLPSLYMIFDDIHGLFSEFVESVFS